MEHEFSTPEQVVGRRVAQMRAEKGMTQAQLAEEMAKRGIEMHQTTIAKLEAGRRPIRVNEVVALTRILDASVSALIPDGDFTDPLVLARHEAELAGRRLELAETHQERIRDALEVAQLGVEEVRAEFEQAIAHLEEIRRSRG